MRDLDVLGVRVETPTNQPIVLLREREGDRYLPVWIGAAEAAAIAFAQQGVEPPRPLTHDLLRDVITGLGVLLNEVQIVKLEDKVFYADLIFSNGVRVSSRTSDAIALALRTESPIRVVDEVMDEAGVIVDDDRDDEVEKFREFLDNVSPEDFDTEGGPEEPAGDDLDPK
ncbi:bifunctional nuclease family protein [Dermatophilus congolensis]|uniref:Uncharacterized ACR, COG1259 n=1 Tax=Dermatophilus congolensis TaxID=1863 RepID=A0A239VKN3_9MICO|nr:bifunctional nuclease family protein [Dermatophilus congolensis]MBO3129386.1 bifunctional nuclease family protein [Dermatophilus congolensis]MBO3131981.1 bifunctional nuclease family protein [Dermatophilus congolensis]MBO3133863.1 bifunctional nuclease family protein [Dermatophilus congolensis]MBO3136093.1 bifunctional nuclease family protein [Dermatophilus congolensis]MBO3138337.1 bifunctional nuclease family protein [Dermatophilus congolensis]